MSTIDKRTNIYVRIGRKFSDEDALRSWKATTGSKRRTCCIAGCKNEIYCCVMVWITNGKDKDKAGFIPVCMKHAMQSSIEFPIGKETAVVFANENRDGMEMKKMKKRSNPKAKKPSKKLVFDIYNRV